MSIERYNLTVDERAAMTEVFNSDPNATKRGDARISREEVADHFSRDMPALFYFYVLITRQLIHKRREPTNYFLRSIPSDLLERLIEASGEFLSASYPEDDNNRSVEMTALMEHLYAYETGRDAGLSDQHKVQYLVRFATMIQLEKHRRAHAITSVGVYSLLRQKIEYKKLASV